MMMAEVCLGSGSGFNTDLGITAARRTSPSDAAAADVRRTEPVELGGRVMSSCLCTTTCVHGAGSGRISHTSQETGAVLGAAPGSRLAARESAHLHSKRCFTESQNVLSHGCSRLHWAPAALWQMEGVSQDVHGMFVRCQGKSVFIDCNSDLDHTLTLNPNPALRHTSAGSSFMPRGAANVFCVVYADPKLSLRLWCEERIMTSWRPGGDGGGSLVGSGWNSGTVVIRCTCGFRDQG